MTKILLSPDFWILLFVFAFQLIFASPEIMLIGMSIAGGWIYFRRHMRYGFFEGMIFSPIANWLVPLGFTSVFVIKLISVSWALDYKEALSNAFNNVHFILWPGVMIFLSRSNLSPRKAEPWIVGSMVILMVWYLIARIFFPNSEDASCFKAGGHNCGLLGHTMAFLLLWLFVVFTRSDGSLKYKFWILLGMVCGWIAFLGTIRRTEMLGLLLGMLIVAVWRAKGVFSIKQLVVAIGFGGLIFGLTWPVMQPRFQIVSSEVTGYLQGGNERIKAADTSVGARLEMYRVAIEAIKDRPLLGWGAGIKPKHITQYSINPTNPYPFSNFHQQYLQTLLEVGILGGIFAIIIVIYLLYQTIYSPWHNGQIELAALVATLYFTYAWKGLAYASIGYSLPNAAFVFFSAWFWVCIKKRCPMD